MPKYEHAKRLCELIADGEGEITREMKVEAYSFLCSLDDLKDDSIPSGGMVTVHGNEGSFDISRVHYNEYVNMLRDGKKISAIKECRGHYGMGLREAKGVIDEIVIREGI